MSTLIPVTIHTILEEFRAAAHSNRDLGDKFERLIAAYLKTDPLYKEQFSNVWLWDEWPDRGNKPDTGIDLVAKESATGDYCAIQCKFYAPHHTLQKADIDSFFTASGKDPFKSRIIVSTTDKWSVHAENSLQNQHTPVIRLRVQDLDNSPIDWSQFSLRRPQDISVKPKKQLRPHQSKAKEKVIAGFQSADRGKLIMACGTGKTFTSLKIAEAMVPNHGTVLFLVPSISLVAQTLREWTAEAAVSFHSYAVCSDTRVTRSNTDNDDISVHDLAFPATTSGERLAQQIAAFSQKREMNVIFSTYQSIQAVAEAQAQGVPEFDLIICDEAHRTTGTTFAGEDESQFVRVHNQDYIKAKKRLYMTATPRIYDDSARTQAQQNDATICSMDDSILYGPEFHRLGFGEAVGTGLLSDYKVMVLAVDEKFVNRAFQRQLAENSELKLEDAVRITGCWNGLSKRAASLQGAEGLSGDLANDVAPMRRAVAFSRSIKDSKRFTSLFAEIVEEYRRDHTDEEDILCCELDHVDGKMNALERSRKLDWLKEDTDPSENICRILSNARCLSEGVDVPSLDAVMFLNPRNSVVDVVQSVGRVMRKAEGKKYGYIILPIGVPADMEPDVALSNNEKYKVVWQVLQALRAHDDRFNATVNQIELNRQRPDQIQVIGVGDGGSSDGDGTPGQPLRNVQFTFNFPNLDEWREAIYARIVQKCGDRRYWENWAKDVADIASRHETRIKTLIEDSDSENKEAFETFLKGLQENLNPSISQVDAIEMLSQHLITKPVFDALFEDYSFTKHNPVSVAMQGMLDKLEGQALEKETESLDKFYASVRERAKGIDNAEGKQKIITELYDKFFRSAFPRMAERLGIVYTPVEVVDFILRSADEALKREFGTGITDEGVHLLDPFTGTGTFLVRLLQSGLINENDLTRKYSSEIHANEIVLLAYYIAAINIEETFHSITKQSYTPFNGIVLTDTFQMSENDHSFESIIFPDNNERATGQKKADIRVIFGNPPYSKGQEDANDANQNLKYPALDERIKDTYVKFSTATNKNSLYASESRALRWASDRIKDKGIVCYVTNGSFIDGNTADGIRKCFGDEFTTIYCFNLRGNQRTQGELSRREGGKIFGSGSRNTIAIILLVKNPEKAGTCELFYHDIGDYLSREEKLAAIASFENIKSVSWELLSPNTNHDWINQRNDEFAKFAAIGDKSKSETSTLFKTYSAGIKTNRDVWTYNFSQTNLSKNMADMIDFYNKEVERYEKSSADKRENIDRFVSNDSTKISWNRSLKQDLERTKKYEFENSSVVIGLYRPFTRQWVYFNRRFNDMVYQIPLLFPTSSQENVVISVTGMGATKGFSAVVTNAVPNLHLHDTGQCFPLYYYEKKDITLQKDSLFPEDANISGDYFRRESVSNEALKSYHQHYADKIITKEDIFYYVYGILHSQEYKKRFAADLKKMLPRIPMAQDFWAFSKAGRELAKWHLEYESVELYPLEEAADSLNFDQPDRYKVKKMTFGKKGREVDKSVIIFNSHISLTGIPLEAYEYIVNGRPALEWIMDSYQVKRDKDSRILNDPNEYSDDPKYIVNLVKRIVTVSIETVRIVNSLPALNESST